MRCDLKIAELISSEVRYEYAQTRMSFEAKAMTAKNRKIFKDKVINKFKNGFYNDAESLLLHAAKCSNRVKRAIRYGGSSKQISNEIQFALAKVVSMDRYALFDWAVLNNEVHTLSFLTRLMGKYKEEIMYGDNLVFTFFLLKQRLLEENAQYENQKCIDGLKIFLAIDHGICKEKFYKSDYVGETVKKAFISSWMELQREGVISHSCEA